MESQKERIVTCTDCAGALRITSHAGTGSRVVAVHIPPHACPACIQQGYDWFDAVDPDVCDRAFLQDRPQDRFVEKKHRLEVGDRF